MLLRKLLTAALCTSLISVHAQTLFSYGGVQVDTAEFMRAYRKNNPTSGKVPIGDYLDLYINSRLKIREAYERGYDSLPQIKAEMSNLRSQIMQNYLQDEEQINRLMNEVIERSQTDILTAHIFISHGSAGGITDTSSSWRKIQVVWKELQNGKSFQEMAVTYSDDPNAAQNGGVIGWITVFVLPYELENIVYNTKVGTYSDIHRSSAGYHIMMPLERRKAVGSFKARQILLALPPDANDATRNELEQRADSIYQQIKNGADFSEMARLFSNDYVTAASGGMIPPFGVGRYAMAFENAILEAGDGEVIPPFETPHGFHIVQRLSIDPIPGADDVQYRQILRSKIDQSERIETIRYAFAEKVARSGKFKALPYRTSELWLLSDSLLEMRRAGQPLRISPATAIFVAGNDSIRVSDWLAYAQRHRFRTDGSRRSYPSMMNEFIIESQVTYYQRHMEEFNAAFREQLKEFMDGNLFFEIMQREIWSSSQSDSAAIRDLFNKNRNRYQWKQSADAIIVFVTDTSNARLIREQLVKSPNEWRTLAEAMSEMMIADSGRYEWPQLPGFEKRAPAAGECSEPVFASEQQQASFAYIVKVYDQPQPRSFDEAKGLVTSDYQDELDRKWIAELRKKYPVRVNKRMLRKLH